MVQIARRDLIHGLCMAMFWGISGYMMLNHQTSGDLTEMMHKLVGGLSVGTAFVRIACIFWNKLPVIYGGLVLMVGMVLNFANPALSEYWENVLGYPAMGYIAIVLLFSFYLSSISGIFQQVAGGEVVISKQLQSGMEDESTPLVHGRMGLTGSPNHGTIDVSALPVITE